MQMRKILETTLALIILIQGLHCFSCPAPNYRGSVYSTQIVAALNQGAIPIYESQDIQCYNYSLPYTFIAQPEVAISVFDFEAEPSKDLFFYIKPIQSESTSFISFVIRTQWPYTKWNYIHFSFIAEDRIDLESGYYQIDTGSLSSCENGKLIDILLPFKSIYHNGIQIKHNLFLHGFQIATIKNQGSNRSPYEIQITSSVANISGITVSLSVTTNTQVNSIYISYLAFQISTLSIIGGGYVYDSTIVKGNQQIFYAPETNIPRNFARLYGLTGFLLNYNRQKIFLKTKWDGFSFEFKFGADLNLIKYLSFSFIFFTGSQCQDCQGFQIFHNNSCINVCPNGTSKTSQNRCIDCGPGRQWSGIECVTSCPQGQFLSNVTGLCQCPPTLNWNGENCIPCFSGKIWSKNTKTCQCPSPLTWNGFACIKMDPCTRGKVWDVYTYSCQCPQSTYWDGLMCKTPPQCRGGQILSSNFECVCQQGYVLVNDICTYSPCYGGQVWTGSKCICPVGLNFNGVMCLQCINGQKWDHLKSNCSCQSGYKWNGQYCQKSYICSNGRIWNIVYQQCICPQGSYWTGYNCNPVQKCSGGQYFDTTISKCVCLSGFQWDGRSCVQCNNGRAWNVTTLTCSCPIGTIHKNNGCILQQQCSGGKQWCQSSWTCQCPLKTVWNGNFCIANPCSFGQFWNETLRSCQCPDNKTFVNQACVPLQIACTNGRVWNQNIYACSCPLMTFPTINNCDPIPVCPPGKVYNPLNNLCQCPYGLANINSICTDPKCPIGQYYNGFQCQVINCPPPSYFLKDRCVYGGQSKCDFGYIWNGVECSFYPNSCPTGTFWTSMTCQHNGQCGNGFYLGQGNICLPLPQQCIPPSKWQGSKCSIGDNNGCPKGTFIQGNNCMPIQPCKNGFVWDPIYIRCICPPGTINNGNRCVQCANDQKWVPGIGCACPQGSFDSGAACEDLNATKCSAISNTAWHQNKCSCKQGFTKVGFQCICYGTLIGDFCDKCSYKPNSRLVQRTNTCQCIEGYTQIKSICIKRGEQILNEDPSKCSIGTYFDNNHKACLACPDGCITCFNCYKCKICRPQFVYDPASEKCIEYCGDGKRFVLQCDDGNNLDGDGCSRDCQIQSGYRCTGGSPDWKDNCYIYRPQRVKIQQIGQIRRSSSLVLNLKLNYLPESLILSQDCSNKCNQIILGSIISGDKSTVSITSQYLAGTKYIFIMTIEFGRPYIGKFTINVSINNNMIRYFGGAGVQPLDIVVEPSYLMAISNTETLT